MKRILVEGHHSVDGSRSGAYDHIVSQSRPRSRRVWRVSVDFGELGPFVGRSDRDLASLAAALMIYEAKSGEHSSLRKAEISVAVSDEEPWKNKEVSDRLSTLVDFAMSCTTSFNFIKGSSGRDPEEMTDTTEAITLFSGGVDSLAGILAARSHFRSTRGVSVLHPGPMQKIVDPLVKSCLASRGIRCSSVKLTGSGGGLHQIRGFFYMAIGGICASLAKTTNLVVSECGVTMYQPKLLPTDVTTITTHPRLVDLAKGVIQSSLDTKLSVIEPFENLTKAEIMALCSEPQGLWMTHSCYTTRFASHQIPHCGRCFGCITRRLSALVAGVMDSKYNKDVCVLPIGAPSNARWWGGRINPNDMNDVLSTLRFARDILEGELPEETSFQISEYGKEDLYDRFAADILAGISILYDSKGAGRNRILEKAYDAILAEDIMSQSDLKERIQKVRECERSPDFEKTR